jgi:hypothetical protein
VKIFIGNFGLKPAGTTTLNSPFWQLIEIVVIVVTKYLIDIAHYIPPLVPYVIFFTVTRLLVALRTEILKGNMFEKLKPVAVEKTCTEIK